MHLSMWVGPPLSPSQNKTKGFDISHIKDLYLGAEWLLDQIPLLSRYCSKDYHCAMATRSFIDLP